MAAGGSLFLPEPAAHHVRRVLRLRPGDQVEVADGHGWHAPARVGGEGLVVAAAPVRETPAVPALEVVHALPQGRKLDEVVRVLTELGVDRFRPVAAQRSVVSLSGPKADRALARWRAVGWSAAQQSRRVWRPVIERLDSFAATLGEPTQGVRILAHPRAGTRLRDVLRGAAGGRYVVAVGPESGWSDAEERIAADAGWVPATIGRAVLRTEHAAAALLTVVAYETGRIG